MRLSLFRGEPHQPWLKVGQRRLKMLQPPGPTASPAMMRTIPRMMPPLNRVTIPAMTRMTARIHNSKPMGHSFDRAPDNRGALARTYPQQVGTTPGAGSGNRDHAWGQGFKVPGSGY
jgi:hypothetical protein